MTGNRIHRVAELIRDDLAARLAHDVAETRTALVTITEVRLTPDMRQARVYVSVFPDTADRESILAALDRRRGRLKRDMGRALRIRHVPDLEFRLDDTARRSQRIDDLLRGDTGRDPGEE